MLLKAFDDLIKEFGTIKNKFEVRKPLFNILNIE